MKTSETKALDRQFEMLIGGIANGQKIDAKELSRLVKANRVRLSIALKILAQNAEDAKC